MEAAELSVFMISAGLVTSLIAHPSSPIYQFLPNPLVRRLITGVLMGTTAIAIVNSPWGRQSGAHMNPALTLTFMRLGKVAPIDAAFYVASQFAGAVVGITIAAALIGPVLGSPEVRYVSTTPGLLGRGAAFAAELTISFLLMLTVLTSSNVAKLAKYTPWLVGLLIATYITVEAPLSGMSMNPARTFGPAFFGRIWDALWIYFVAPPLGMLLAAEVYVRSRGTQAVWCAKLHHLNRKRCIFRCGYPAL